MAVSLIVCIVPTHQTLIWLPIYSLEITDCKNHKPLYNVSWSNV